MYLVGRGDGFVRTGTEKRRWNVREDNREERILKGTFISVTHQYTSELDSMTEQELDDGILFGFCISVHPVVVRDPQRWDITESNQGYRLSCFAQVVRKSHNGFNASATKWLRFDVGTVPTDWYATGISLHPKISMQILHREPTQSWNSWRALFRIESQNTKCQKSMRCEYPSQDPLGYTH